MRQTILIFAAALLSSALTYAATVKAQAHSAQVVTDDGSGVIRFVIDGKEVARISDAGLSVREDITYGGLLIDRGISGYDRVETP